MTESRHVPATNISVGALLLTLGLGLMADAEHGHGQSYLERNVDPGKFISGVEGTVGFVSASVGLYFLYPLILNFFSGPRGGSDGGPIKPA